MAKIRYTSIRNAPLPSSEYFGVCRLYIAPDIAIILVFTVGRHFTKGVGMSGSRLVFASVEDSDFMAIMMSDQMAVLRRRANALKAEGNRTGAALVLLKVRRLIRLMHATEWL